jgi:hypothetical protein
MRLLSAATGRGSGAWPAIVEVWQRGAGRWDSLYVFDRPVNGADLAALLSDGQVAADSLDTPVPEVADLPPHAQRVLKGLTADGARTLAELWT